jgi:hypothetical protein
MNRADIDLVFGRDRLRMVTDSHVEVFREESKPGERRRYSKRFLATGTGELQHWAEREMHILTHLHGLGVVQVPEVAQFFAGATGQPALLRTYDAGVTVDHWATLLPVQRDGVRQRHVFEDCAHWWALAHHCLLALEAIHGARLVHLDLKADNICIPASPPDVDPDAPGATLSPRFEQLALIDFAFSLFSDDDLSQPLPIGRQTEYTYQSPRLISALEAGRRGDLGPTRQLDWRCDMFSLAAMLRRYLPDPKAPPQGHWTAWRREQAVTLVRRLLEAHDSEEPAQRPHGVLIALTRQALADADLAAALRQEWVLVDDDEVAPSDLATPLTRVVMPAVAREPRTTPQKAPAVQPRPAMAVAPPAASTATPGWIALAAIAAPLLMGGGWWWWSMQPGTPLPASTAPPLPEPKPTPTQPMPSPQATATEPPTAPVASMAPTAPMAASEAAPTPPVAEPAPVVHPPPDAGAITGTEAPRRARPATARPPAPRPAAANGSPEINEAERQRALEWLTRRGPAPRSGMSMPPAPPATPGSAAER